MNYLFISSKCKHCVQLQEKYLNSNNIQQIQIINIDTKKRPNFIKCVPSIIFDDGDLIEGTKVFQYFDNMNKIQNDKLITNDSFSYEQQQKYSNIMKDDSLLIPKLKDIL